MITKLKKSEKKKFAPKPQISKNKPTTKSGKKLDSKAKELKLLKKITKGKSGSKIVKNLSEKQKKKVVKKLFSKQKKQILRMEALKEEGIKVRNLPSLKKLKKMAKKVEKAEEHKLHKYPKIGKNAGKGG
jgi:hypothetical protein